VDHVCEKFVTCSTAVNGWTQDVLAADVLAPYSKIVQVDVKVVDQDEYCICATRVEGEELCEFNHKYEPRWRQRGVQMVAAWASDEYLVHFYSSAWPSGVRRAWVLCVVLATTARNGHNDVETACSSHSRRRVA